MFRPREDFILVRPIERVKSETIAVVSNELPNLGEVVAVGPGKRDKKDRLIPLDVRVGDTVRFGEFRGMFPSYVSPDGIEHLIMQEADVAGVVEDQIAA